MSKQLDLSHIPSDKLMELGQTMTYKEIGARYGVSGTRMEKEYKLRGLKKPNARIGRAQKNKELVTNYNEIIEEAKRAYDKQFERPLLKVSIGVRG